MFERLKKFIPERIFKALSPLYHFLMSGLAALIYNFPSRKLIIIGVTGTAGKTSTVYLIAKMLSAAGYKTGFTSTSIFSDSDSEWLNDKKMTMPGRFFIQKLLKQMVKNQCHYAVVETTSQGVEQFRHRFINYDILVFTGLYPEHIEAHGSFDNYRLAKGKLFAHLKRGAVKYVNDQRAVVRPNSGLAKIDLTRITKTIIVNGDDDNAGYFLNFWSEAKIVYSFNPEIQPDYFLKKLSNVALVKDFTLITAFNREAGADGVSFSVGEDSQGATDQRPANNLQESGNTPNPLKINLKLLGGFNAINALAAYAVGFNQNILPEKIKIGLESVTGLAGKLEKIEAGQEFTAIVDYSFEPEALKKLYQTVTEIPHQRIIHLLGSAGGGRDQARRPLLGRLAAENSDYVIVTNEDPYDEDPIKIINEVAAGAEIAGKEAGKNLFKILDRREAIKKALLLAEKDDLLLFTGKGAEQAICVAHGRMIPWDEREEVRQAIVDKMCIDKRE